MQISIKNRNYFALSAVSFLHLFAWSAAMSFFAIWLGQHLGIGATKTGLLYSANALAALCMQPVLGFISDKIGLKKTLLFTILIILLLIGPFFIYIYGPLLVSNFYLGAILGGIYLGFIFNAGYGVIDSYIKGIRNFDLSAAYEACKLGITEKTLAPWSGIKGGEITKFYWENGYLPALAPGEQETADEVHPFENANR